MLRKEGLSSSAETSESKRFLSLIKKQQFKEANDFLDLLESKGDIEKLKYHEKGMEDHNALNYSLLQLGISAFNSKTKNADFIKLTEKLLQTGANPNITFSNSFNAFLAYCCVNQPEALELIINNNKNLEKTNISHADISGKDALYYMLATRAVENLELCHEKGYVDLNRIYILNKNNTSLHIACLYSNTESTLTEFGLSTEVYEDVFEDESIRFLMKHNVSNIENDNGILPEELIPEGDDTLPDGIEEKLDKAYNDLSDLRLEQEKKAKENKQEYQYKF